MQYKTIVLELFEQRPKLEAQLRQHRLMLTTVEQYALELKKNHEAWQETLRQSRPDSDPSQIANEALELAVKELQDRLPAELPEDQSSPLSLDAAMAFLRRHTPPA